MTKQEKQVEFLNQLRELAEAAGRMFGLVQHMSLKLEATHAVR